MAHVQAREVGSKVTHGEIEESVIDSKGGANGVLQPHIFQDENFEQNKKDDTCAICHTFNIILKPNVILAVHHERVALASTLWDIKNNHVWREDTNTLTGRRSHPTSVQEVKWREEQCVKVM